MIRCYNIWQNRNIQSKEDSDDERKNLIKMNIIKLIKKELDKYGYSSVMKRKMLK
jgi:hypothetical protein